MIYIKYGAAGRERSASLGGTRAARLQEGGGTTSTYPFEQWRYRYIEGIGTNIKLNSSIRR